MSPKLTPLVLKNIGVAVRGGRDGYPTSVSQPARILVRLLKLQTVNHDSLSVYPIPIGITERRDLSTSPRRWHESHWDRFHEEGYGDSVWCASLSHVSYPQ
jgi:hypothetical protein